MEENLRNRLKVMRNRLTTIDDLLIQEHILNDSRQFKTISKERATLDKVVFLFNQFETNENNLSDALVMRNDSDPEIAQLGKAEVEQLTKAQEKLMEQINRFNFSGFNYSATGGNQLVLQIKMIKPNGIGYNTQIDYELTDLERQELIALLITTKDAN
jgi:t-SNARE complex subunit (syntaxin)